MLNFLTTTTVCGFSLYHVLAFFLIYSCTGWCLEVIFAAATTGQLVNRGFLNGPVCPIYGFGMVIVLFTLTPLQDSVLLLYIGGVILPSALELVGGWALYKLYHTRWWDYSDFPFNIGGYICLQFSLLWGVNYYAESFQKQSGVYARESTPEELARVTEYFARQLAGCADQVQRDENGLFAESRDDIFADSVRVFDGVYDAFPCLVMEDHVPKGVRFSTALSAMDFTGFYFPFTGEANLNIDSPACYLPSTIAHEMAHQRGIASEQECNFIGILAATRCADPAYRYSGWLEGYVYLSNALYRADPDRSRAIRETLPETVIADLRADNTYWAAFRGPVSQASESVYDAFLKTNGDASGIRSYGMVTDLLVTYFDT